MAIIDQLKRVVLREGKVRPIESISISQRVHKSLMYHGAFVGTGGVWTHFIGIPLSVRKDTPDGTLCVLNFGSKSMSIALDGQDGDDQ